MTGLQRRTPASAWAAWIRPWAGAALAVTVVSLAACSSSSPGGTATNPPAPTGPLASTSASPSTSPGVAAVGASLTILAPLGLNLRSAPATTGQVLGSMAQGTVVTVVAHTDQNGGWYQVKGSTQTGWMTADPQFSSPRHFNLYQSGDRGFSALYLDTWTFAEEPADVVFRPQTGDQTIVVTAGASLTALGPAGRSGYSAVSADSVEVYGITCVLRLYDRAGAAPAPTAGIASLEHLAEIRVPIDASHALRIDFMYSTAADLAAFRDFYNSVILPQPASPGATPAPSP